MGLKTETRPKGATPPQERLRHIFSCDPDKGTLTWVNPPKSHPRLRGKAAGSRRRSLVGSDYIYVCVDGLAYGAHRIIWAWLHGDCPPVIDHINGDGCDNRRRNLRACSQADNTRNHGKTINGSGLPVGVRRAKSGRYVARLGFRGEMETIGTYDTPEDASRAYMNRRSEMFGDFHREVSAP